MRVIIAVKKRGFEEVFKTSFLAAADPDITRFIIIDSLIRNRRLLSAQPPDLVVLDKETFLELWTPYDEVYRDSAPSSQETIAEACAYINTHLSEHLDLDGIAAHCFVSKTHLSNLFRNRMGTSVKRYIEARRLEKAQKLLAQPGIQVKDIQRRVGFRSSSHFSSQFRKRYGISPTQYRKSRIQR